MKNNITISLILLSVLKGYSQKSCCSKPNSTESFAMLISDLKFVDTHLNLDPFTLENQNGNGMTFTTNDGVLGNGYELKSKNKSNNYIIVAYQWWGLND